MNTRILIVEDDAALLRGLKDNFTSRGFQVEIAAEGQSGLELALAAPPDVMVLDIMLPRVNGYEICRSVRARGLDFPIIMLTAKGQEEDIVLGLNLGADDYVTKPFRIAELVARVNAFVRRRNRDRAETHRFGGFELDSARHKLFRDGQEVELTPREFRLLAYFLERQGRALTREDILNSVWGHSIMVTERSVDRCITTLRAKIGAHYIETVRDVGYRFEVGSD
jgi:DNA-binding response OmpR family regulator